MPFQLLLNEDMELSVTKAEEPHCITLQLAGATGLGVLSTFFLPNTLEDLLAVAVGGAVGYAALLNLPLKRNDAKEKLTRVANNFAEVGYCQFWSS